MSGEEPATQIAPVESPQMVSTVKLPILKKGEYTLWSMRMEQYLTNTDYSLWQVILNGDGPIQVTTDENGVETEVPPKTAQALLARQRERKAKSILLLAIPDEYQLRFHAIKDAKTLWAAIKSSLLEVHGAAVSNEDTNQKFLRALPSSWNNVALIMRNKDGIYDLDIDDLYSNLKVFEADIKGSSRSSLNSQNVTFLSAEDTSSSNESNSPQLDDEDLEQIDHDDLEEMDLKWQVAMLSIRVKRFYKKTRRKLIFNGKEPIDGLGYDWSYVAQDKPTEFALMAYTSNSSWSNIEANLEIVAYQLGLESVEAQLIIHQKNEVAYEEKIAVLEFEEKDKSNDITRLKNQLDETLREKDDLKAKLEQFETSSKNLNKLINSQLSAKDKTGLGYGDQLNENDSSNSELFNSVFDSRSSDGDDNQTNDRWMILFIGYRPNKTSASVSQVETSTSQTSNTSVEMPRVESVRPSGVIIEDWVSNDEDIIQSNDLQATDKPSFKRTEFTNARNEPVKPKQAEKPRMITQNPKVDRRDWNGQMTQKLGLVFGFTKKACFVCGSYIHLIKDCDFHEKRMAKFVLKNMGKVTVLTRFGRVPISTAKQSSFRAATSTGAIKQVNTATHTNRVNVSKTRTNTFHKSHSPIRRPFHKSTTPNISISNEIVNIVRVKGVNTAGQTAVSAVKGNGVTAIKASAGWKSTTSFEEQMNIDSGCSRHMTGNKDFLTDYQYIDGGFVTFGGGTRGGKITGLAGFSS
ncbi:hypothetical protein Tco_0477733 [Tanacetum coccineum]